MIADKYYFHGDFIQLPCDSIWVPEYKWQEMWSSEGMALQEFYDRYGTYSRQVMIPVTDSARFFKKDFQFRFINWASLSSDYNPAGRTTATSGM